MFKHRISEYVCLKRWLNITDIPFFFRRNCFLHIPAWSYSTIRDPDINKVGGHYLANYVEEDYRECNLDTLLKIAVGQEDSNEAGIREVDSKCVYESHGDGPRKLENILTGAINQQDDASLTLIHKVLEAILIANGRVTAAQLEGVLRIAAKDNGMQQYVALHAVYMAMLGCKETMTDGAMKYVDTIVQHVRISKDPAEQLEAINMYYAIIKRHPYMLHQLAPQHRCYLEYIRKMAQYVRFKVPHEDDIPQVKGIRKTLDILGVEHYAAIAGHMYIPLVINRTNSAIDVLTSRDICYGTDEHAPLTAIRKQLLNDIGWNIYYIMQKEWDTLQTDKQKEDYLSKRIAFMYMDAQFMERPPWVQPYHVNDGNDINSFQ